MRIIDTIKSEKVTLSFEVFPPKTSDKFENTYAAAESIARLNPAYISVTYGAGAGEVLLQRSWLREFINRPVFRFLRT